MSENVDGWLVESNRLWTYSADDELAPRTAYTPTRFEHRPYENQTTMPTDRVAPKDRFVQEQSTSDVQLEQQSASLNRVLEKLYRRTDENQITVPADRVSPEVGFVHEQSVSAVKFERQSASLDGVLDKLYQRTDGNMSTSTTNRVSPEVGLIHEQSLSAVKVERQSASLDGVLHKLYQAQPDSAVDDAIQEEKAVPARANPSAFDLNASFRKLQKKADADDEVVKEDIIVAQSKPPAASSCSDRATFAQLQKVQEQTVNEDVIVAQSAAPKASSRHVENLAIEELVSRQETKNSHAMHDTVLSRAGADHIPSMLMDQTMITRISSASEGGMVITKTEVTREVTRETVETSLQHDEEGSSVESTDVRPFPPHLSRITASSVSDDDTLNDQQHDATTLETDAGAVVEATSSGSDTVLTRQVPAVVSDQTSVAQISSVSDGEVVITKTEVTREVRKVITGSEVTASSVETVSTSTITRSDAEITQASSPDSSHAASTVVTTKLGEVQQQPSSDEAGSVSVSESVFDVGKSVSTHQETVSTTQHCESSVVTSEVGDVQLSSGAVVSAPDVETVAADTTADQSQGCHIIITETRIERQLIGCDADQSQPVVIVPEDTVIQ